MQRERGKNMGKLPPGVWSSDDYIRTWALLHGITQGDCLIPLQSLHDCWVAKIRFDQPGIPVERFVEDEPARVDELAACE